MAYCCMDRFGIHATVYQHTTYMTVLISCFPFAGPSWWFSALKSTILIQNQPNIETTFSAIRNYI